MFFLEDFDRLGKPSGCHLNFDKNRIMASTNGSSSIPSITRKYGKVIADSVEKALNTLSIPSSIVDGKPVSTWVEVTTGLRLLRQPLGSTTFAHAFFKDRLQANLEDSTKLTNNIPDPHTALRLFHSVPSINFPTSWVQK